MVGRDAVDMRLLQLVAEAGRVAVHELAATVGLDAREVAARLVTLSAGGLPLLVGVECDQKALRNYVANAGHGLYSQQQPPSGRFPAQQHQPPTGPPQHQQYPQNPGSGLFRTPTPTPSTQPPVTPSPARQQPRADPPPSPPSGSVPVQQAPVVAEPEPVAAGVDPISVWGPPQSSSWARGDEPTRPASRPRNQRRPASGKRGGLGDTLLGLGPRGEQAQLRLVAVTDPADDVLTGTGIAPGDAQRPIVVHLELTNGASTPFPQRADEHLQVITAEGERFGPTPVTLPGRSAHHSGLRAGETAAGHTLFLVPAEAELRTVRWASGPDDDAAVSWRL